MSDDVLITAIELTAYDPGIAAARVLYLATKGFCTEAGDSPAHTHFKPRISNPGQYRLAALRSGATYGNSQAGYGRIELVNVDGGLDAWADYAYDGRPITVRIGTAGTAYPVAWSTVLSGVVDRIEWGWKSAAIIVRDRQADLQRPHLGVYYAGNNALPNGIEGTVDELKGKPKPRVYGYCRNIPLPCVNTSRLIYQVSVGALSDVLGVFDRGSEIPREALVASQAALEATAPAAGYYRAWLAGGLIRLGTRPTTPTADVQGAGAAANWTPGRLMETLLLDAGWAAGDLVAADLTTLDAATSGVCGLYVDDQRTTLQLIDDLAQTAGALWWIDAARRFRVAQLATPGGAPVATFDRNSIVSIERKATADSDRGVPVWRVELGYQRNWLVQDRDLAGATTITRQSWLREQWRRAAAQDTSVRTVHLAAPVLSADTYFDAEAAASAEAARRLALYGTRRDLLEVTVRIKDAGLFSVVTIGTVVSVQLPRLGYSNGRLMRVLGIEPDLRRQRTTLVLWG